MSNTNRWIALIPLLEASLPTFDEVQRAYRNRFPEDAPPTSPGGTERMLACSLDDAAVSATLIDRPIPATQLGGPCAAAWYWPGAAAALENHASHLMLTMVDEGGSAVERAMNFTRWTAAVAAAAKALGVFWGPSRTIHRPGDFIDQAVQSSPHSMPLYLWVDFRMEPVVNQAGGEDFLRLYTTGLLTLGQSEIEVANFAGSPQTLLESAYNVAHYLLDRKQAVSDGDTFGLADEVQVTARRAPSMLGGEIEVIRLEWDA